MLSFFPVVGIGTPPPPHPQASEFPSPLVQRGGGYTLARGTRGMRGQTLLYFRHICTVLCDEQYLFCGHGVGVNGVNNARTMDPNKLLNIQEINFGAQYYKFFFV